MELSDRHRSTASDGSNYVPLEISELSDILGLSAQQVEGALAELEGHGVIRRSAGGFRVLDWGALEAWAGPGRKSDNL